MTREGKGVVIVGATSAIARAVARCFAEKGYNIVLAARDGEENITIARNLVVRYGVEAHPLGWDAEAFDTHAAFFQACIDSLGDSMSGVVLVSGYMEEQKVAQDDWDVARRTIDVNFTAAVSLLNRFANHLEARRKGFIAGVSSVAGDRGRQSNYLYGAAKAGFTTYLEGLRNRLQHADVQVTTIKPGFVDTKMTWGVVPFAMPPEAAGRAIVRAIESRKNVVYIPWFWRYIMLIIRHIPEAVFKRMKM